MYYNFKHFLTENLNNCIYLTFEKKNFDLLNLYNLKKFMNLINILLKKFMSLNKINKLLQINFILNMI